MWVRIPIEGAKPQFAICAPPTDGEDPIYPEQWITGLDATCDEVAGHLQQYIDWDNPYKPSPEKHPIGFIGSPVVPAETKS